MKKYCLLCYFIALIIFNGYSQNLIKIDPDTVTQGQYVKIAITGSKTSFKSITNPVIVYFVKNYDLKIWADSLEIKNDTFMYGYFQIPYTFSGSYDLIINSTPFLSLTNALFIKTQSIVPEITRIDPDTAYQCTYFTYRIYGKNTHFLNCNYFKVWQLYSYADVVNVINDTIVEVAKQIPFSITPGKYSIKIENSIDGIILKSMILTVLISPYAPELTGIKPDSVEQGKTVKTLITARNTFFTTSKVQYIRIWQNNYGIYCDSFKILNDTCINAWFKPVYSSYTGIYDLQVKHTPDEVLLLKSCFRVTATNNPPKIVSISPDSAYQNDNVIIFVRGHNTHFTYLNRKPGLSLRLNSYYITSTSITVVNDSVFYYNANIPLEAPVGIYDITVHDSLDGKMILKNVFKVIKKTNTPSILLALPDSFIHGDSITFRVFCRNTHFTITDQPIIIFENKSTGTTFYPDKYNIINDSTIFGTIKKSRLLESPLGIYDLKIGNYADGLFMQKASVSILSGKYSHQIISISPNKFLQGDTYSIEIIGKNTKFTKATAQGVRLLYHYSSILNANSYNVVNDTLIKATFTFPTGYPGRWKIEVKDSGNIKLTFPVEIILPATVPQFTRIEPDFYKIGESQSFIIHSKNTLLTQYPFKISVFLIRNMSKDTIYATNFKVIDDTTASFDLLTSKTVFPGDFEIFLWPIGLSFYDGLKFSRFTNTAKIVAISPDSSIIEQKVMLQINCKGTKFTKDEIVYPVFTSPLGNFIYSDSVIIVNDTLLQVLVSIPLNAEKGVWDVTLLTDQEGDFHLKNKFKINEEVSLKEINEVNIKIYPNPFSEYINIQSDSPITQVVLCDLTGKILFENKGIINNQCLISTNNLGSGVYLLKIIDENKVVLRKMMKK